MMESFSLGPSAVWCDIKLHTKVSHPKAKVPGLHNLRFKAAHGKTYFCISAFGLRFLFLDLLLHRNTNNLQRVQTLGAPVQTGQGSKSRQGSQPNSPCIWS